MTLGSLLSCNDAGYVFDHLFPFRINTGLDRASRILILSILCRKIKEEGNRVYFLSDREDKMCFRLFSIFEIHLICKKKTIGIRSRVGLRSYESQHFIIINFYYL